MTDIPREPMFEVLSAPVNPAAVALHRYWQDLPRTEAGLPRRADIGFDDLVELRCADRVFILEPVGGTDWQYRLLGSEIVRYFGRDVTKIPLRRHMHADEAEEAIRLSDRVAETRAPIFLRVRFSSGDHTGEIETMSLPILGRDETTVWLFGGSFFTPDD